MNELFNSKNPAMRFLANIFNIFWVNLLFLFTSLPIITIGPSLCALYKVCLKIVSGEEFLVYKEYFKEFKASFKKGLLLWLIVLGVGAFLGFDLYLIIWRTDIVSERFSFVKYAVFVLIFLLAQVFLYGFPLLASFENSLKNTIKNSLLLSIQKIQTTIMLVVIWIFSLVILHFFPDFFYGMIGFDLFFNIALRALLSSLFLHRAFGLKKYQTNRDGSVTELDYDDMIEIEDEDLDDEDLESFDEELVDEDEEQDDVDEDETDDSSDNKEDEE
ncbi:MAG: DUF624 domain-containing protein [Clostridiales bacterium]|nr:DUF624 domain-containing protein [Candidatus Scatonaster coprocaballi]